ncbi:GNAT family N-acetyltransferase [Pseudonocardia alaniniphila]|uniref:GNAT family N-acetyltransferase n=1 Tax=Pseudonocardia alaniniphila TaxID=75291 RepID=A0ABS9THR1_9PSEU|nr:GNAT family N-acetyltransferase [Pseudonocardia alaniniphila]MCH6168047.1 GNAT family N-acetyltransferase [Pseudonocardia alaniniphila]
MTARQTIIRAATLMDEPTVYSLAAEMATSFAVERESFRRSLGELVAADNALLLVAETDGKVSGYVLGFTHPAFYANGRVAWVEEIAVQAGQRRQRVGALLMEEFERRALDAGARLVALATRRAADFYLAIGYEESATYFRKLL